DFQSRGTGLFKRNDAPILRNFDRSYLRWETKYFSDNLLGAVAAVPENSRKELEHEFDLLAQAADSQPKIFMHRDFQSQNILLHNGRVRFVDFQGARIGPVGYDIMSLVNDPYMELSLKLRRKLEKYYCTQLAASYSPAKECDLTYCLVIAGLQRSMQALGAYGYLGLTAGKKHYLKFIPAGLALLKEGLERLAAMPEAPLRLNRLTEIVKALETGSLPE
ncbi:MAG: phosphotransferase, partial [Victivallaceae bacterium]